MFTTVKAIHIQNIIIEKQFFLIILKNKTQFAVYVIIECNNLKSSNPV